MKHDLAEAVADMKRIYAAAKEIWKSIVIMSPEDTERLARIIDAAEKWKDSK